MALKKEDIFTCSICLQLLEDPVTIGCGHSYCKTCINAFWDRKSAEQAVCSCPQCRQIFKPRPTLYRNALLAELLEEHKKASEACAVGDSGPSEALEDVLCDVCTGDKRSACKFCLTCLLSYCQIHLQPHNEVPPLKKHTLTKATQRSKHICERHHKLQEIYCRTDQMCLCALCVFDGHQGHETTTVTEEMKAMQRHLQRTKQEVGDRVVHSQSLFTELKDIANSVKDTAWEVCDEFERISKESIRLYATIMEKKIADIREKVGEDEKAGLDLINTEMAHLRSEMGELNKMNIQLTELFQTEEPIQFLQNCQAFSYLPAFGGVHTRMDILTKFVRNQKDKMKNVADREKCKFHKEYSEIALPRKLQRITSRQYLVTKYKNHTLAIDPNTVAACLSLTSSNRELSWGPNDQAHPNHTERFTYYPQALCQQGLTDDSYWEVEWDGGIVEVAVSYRGIQRKGSGNDCCFGHNDLSWKLICCSSGSRFLHNNLERAGIPRVGSKKVGVHLRYQEGILSFYSVNTSNEFKLLHQSEGIFTEPLYPGFSIDLGSTLKICTM